MLRTRAKLEQLSKIRRRENGNESRLGQQLVSTIVSHDVEMSKETQTEERKSQKRTENYSGEDGHKKGRGRKAGRGGKSM